MPYTAADLEVIRKRYLPNLAHPTTSRTQPSRRSETPKRDIRTVSFNSKLLAGAKPMPPGHRNASAVRSAIHSPSPRGRMGLVVSEDNEELEQYSDESICKQVHELRADIVKFATRFQVVPRVCRRSDPLNALLARESNIETVAFASRLLLEGPDGRESWEQLFEDPVALQALVVGMITRTLKEKVFDLPYFGATPDEQQRLDAWQEDAAKLHGFERQRQGKSLVEDIVEKSNASEADTARRVLEGTILAQLFKLIQPLYNLGGRAAWPEQHAAELLPSLKPILSKAISCAHDMKRSPQTAFEWTNAFKDFKFDQKLAECFNVTQMLETSPYEKHAGTGRVRLKPEQEKRSQSIIAGIVSPGLVGYRRNKVEESALGEEAADDEAHLGHVSVARADNIADGRPKVLRAPATGFQRQVIMKDVVLLRWGVQSLGAQYLGIPGAYEQTLARGEKEDKTVAIWDLFVEHHSGKKVQW